MAEKLLKIRFKAYQTVAVGERTLLVKSIQDGLDKMKEMAEKSALVMTPKKEVVVDWEDLKDGDEKLTKRQLEESGQRALFNLREEV